MPIGSKVCDNKTLTVHRVGSGWVVGTSVRFYNVTALGTPSLYTNKLFQTQTVDTDFSGLVLFLHETKIFRLDGEQQLGFQDLFAEEE